MHMSVEENTSENFSLKETIGTTPNPDAYTFMVKIWVEEVEDETGQVLWRGYLKNVFDRDEVHHFQDLEGLVCSLRPYLKKLGIGGEDDLFR